MTIKCPKCGSCDTESWVEPEFDYEGATIYSKCNKCGETYNRYDPWYYGQPEEDV